MDMEISKVAVLGLGYVGTVTTACLAEKGLQIVGVDPNTRKVDFIKEGVSPIVEPELGGLLKTAHQKGLLSAVSSYREALKQNEPQVTIVCVGTPSKADGSIDLKWIDSVAAEISSALDSFAGNQHLLVFRSTMLPGSTKEIIQKHFNENIASGKLEVWFVPEFLREGSAVSDFRVPSLCAIGVSDGKSVATPEALALFGADPSDVVSWETAETLKYACNSFHAIKVAFANEVGRLSKRIGVDSREVMRLLCKDTVLNISSYYMKPGNPFGGSCLPKDVAALNSMANQASVQLPLMKGVSDSNRVHQEALYDLVASLEGRRIGILGLSFKAATDDLRNSPMVLLAEALLGKGYDVKIFDPNLDPTRLVGANREAATVKLPHLHRLMEPEIDTLLDFCDTLIISQKCIGLETLQSRLRPSHNIIDVNGWRGLNDLNAKYHGFCW